MPHKTMSKVQKCAGNLGWVSFGLAQMGGQCRANRRWKFGGAEALRVSDAVGLSWERSVSHDNRDGGAKERACSGLRTLQANAEG